MAKTSHESSEGSCRSIDSTMIAGRSGTSTSTKSGVMRVYVETRDPSIRVSAATAAAGPVRSNSASGSVTVSTESKSDPGFDAMPDAGKLTDTTSERRAFDEARGSSVSSATASSNRVPLLKADDRTRTTTSPFRLMSTTPSGTSKVVSAGARSGGGGGDVGASSEQALNPRTIAAVTQSADRYVLVSLKIAWLAFMFSSFPWWVDPGCWAVFARPRRLFDPTIGAQLPCQPPCTRREICLRCRSIQWSSQSTGGVCFLRSCVSHQFGDLGDRPAK